MSVILLWIAVFLLFASADGYIHRYNAEYFVHKGNAFVFHGGNEGIHSPLSYHSNEGAFIRFERILFRRPKECANFSSGPIQAVVFDVEDRETIGGSAYGGQRAVCCTEDLKKIGACSLARHIIHRPSATNPDWPQVFDVTFGVDEETTIIHSKTLPVTKTGMYNLYFIHCDPRLIELTVEGNTVWKNPTGYLPGRMAPLMKFYGIMSLMFVIMGIFWFFQNIRFWKEILPLQNCITVVITLGMLEMAFWYFDYAKFNQSGIRPIGITVWAVTFGTVKRTVSRLVILMVCMGYGVVRPTLGGLTSKVIMLGATFFSASEVLELVENVGTESDISGNARLFLVLPVAILDAFFILWIFRSLSATLNKLQSRRIMVKMEIYRKFTNALVVAVVLSVGWICYEMYFRSTDLYNQQWQKAWIIPAFWQNNLEEVKAMNNRFMYSEEGTGGEELGNDEAFTFIKPSPLPLIATESGYNSETTTSSSDGNAAAFDEAKAD